jgi:hypothetical protein
LEDICVSLVTNYNVNIGIQINDIFIDFDQWDFHSFILSLDKYCEFIMNETIYKTNIELYDQGTEMNLQFSRHHDKIMLNCRKVSDDTKYVGKSFLDPVVLVDDIRKFFISFDETVKLYLPVVCNLYEYSNWLSKIKNNILNGDD